MEGIMDAPMRALLTERGGFTFCISEFLRISQGLLPARTYYKHVPELNNDCRTPSGTPIQFQLLGGDEEKLALSALRAMELGAGAIDLNFGCPAPTVNRHDGGATLLRYPQRIRGIVAAVRGAVPTSVPVSAKLRLGWENSDDIFVNAEQAWLGGASWITIHGRTRMQGYTPPAYWKNIGEVQRRIGIPVVANGEIWNREDFLRCREETQCIHFMIGRGALADPSLQHEIGRELGLSNNNLINKSFGADPLDWEPILRRFAEISAPTRGKSQYTSRRIKQWLGMANKRRTLPWFEQIKHTKSLDELFSVVRNRMRCSEVLVKSR